MEPEIKRISFYNKGKGLLRGDFKVDPEKFGGSQVSFEIAGNQFDFYPKLNNLTIAMQLKKMVAERIKNMSEIPPNKQKRWVKICETC